MITVIGRPEFDDYLRALRFHGRSRAFLVAAILGALAMLAWLISRNSLYPVFVVLYVVVLRPVFVRVQLKRHWRQTPSAHGGPKTYGLDEAGFHSRDDEGNGILTHWDKFLKSRESKDSFLLYLSPQMFIFLPKRFMSADDQEAARKLLRERIGRGKIAAPQDTASGEFVGDR